MRVTRMLVQMALVLGITLTTNALAELPPEEMGVITAPPPTPHRAYVVDFEFTNLVIQRVVVLDPDQKRFLGMVSTGNFAPSTLSKDGRWLLTADVFYSRGVRGTRVDVLTVHDTQTLEPAWEVEIPTKRAMSLTQRYGLGTSSDDRFVYIYNFTPATSITVVDFRERRVIGEITIPGCVLTYPVGARKVVSLCGDGSLQLIQIDDNGQEVARNRTKFFDPEAEKLNERATNVGDTYYFTTTTGTVRAVDFSGNTPKILPAWQMAGKDEQAEGWAPGGWQLIAVAPKLNRMYALMHPAHEPRMWEDPSTTIWVFDLKTRRKIGTIEAPTPVWSINATRDDNPLLLGANVEGGLEIFDLKSGEHRGTMDGVVHTGMLIHTH